MKLVSVHVPEEMYKNLEKRRKVLDETMSGMAHRLFTLELMHEPKPPKAREGWEKRKKKANDWQLAVMEGLDESDRYRMRHEHEAALLREMETDFEECVEPTYCEWCGQRADETRMRVMDSVLRRICRKCDEDPRRIDVDDTMLNIGFKPARCCANCMEPHPDGKGGAYCHKVLKIQPGTVCDHFRWSYIGMDPVLLDAVGAVDVKAKIRRFLQEVEIQFPVVPEEEKDKWFLIFKKSMQELWKMVASNET